MQRLINQHAKLSAKFTAKLFWVISIIAFNCRAYAKKPDDLQLIANHPVFLHAGRLPSVMETSKKICFHLYVTYQNVQKRTLYVTGGCLLRANPKKRHFARKPVLAYWVSRRCTARHLAKNSPIRKNAGQSQSQPDRLRSAFHRNGTFSRPLFDYLFS